MRLPFTLLLIVSIQFVFAQEKLIRGRLTDSSGAPMPGVSITIKGTKTGTTSDADGNYSIKAPVGSVLVFSFVGMTTKEIVVKGDGAPQRPARIPETGKPIRIHEQVRQPFSSSDSIPTRIPGVAILDSRTPSYTGNFPANPDYIRSFKRVGHRYYIRQEGPGTSPAWRLEFTTTVGMEQIGRLASLQNDYVQGRPINGVAQWRGPDQGEIFSWGPMLRTLEYDGQSYPYDQNGKLTTAGKGNGIHAKAYDPLRFFRPGFTNTNELTLSRRTRGFGNIRLNGEYRIRSGVIPGSSYERGNLMLNTKNIRMSESLKLNSSITYNYSQGSLLNRGANLASIIGSVLRTPVSFDNSNDLGSNAFRNSSSYLLSDGAMRTHAPGVADNPYGLANLFPDNERLNRVIASADLNYSHARFNIAGHATFDDQVNKSIFGIAPGPGNVEGRKTDRRDQQSIITSAITPSYHFNLHRSSLKLSAGYQHQLTRRELQRVDGMNFPDLSRFELNKPDSVHEIIRTLERSAHEISLNGVLSYREKLTVRLAGRSYFSNTLKDISYTNFFPALGVKLNISNLLNNSIAPEVTAFGSWSAGIHEAPLLYRDWGYASTTITAARYNTFYETSELFLPEGLNPETEDKWEAGLSAEHGGASLTVTWYNNTTEDFVTPAQRNETFALINAGTIRNRGVLVSAEYANNPWAHTAWGLGVSWEKYTNEVISMNAGEIIPLAGFSDIRTVLSPGDPVGAIYGTSWKRTASGQRLIGSDGFPVANTEHTMIGNPLPDWKLNWNGFLKHKRLRIAMAFEYRHGGDLYNGTRAALDYLGRSSDTGGQRNISNYIFEGETESGAINTTPVAFADPGRELAENRWVRYGFSGVGEDYIEKASVLRLNDFSVAYGFNVMLHRRSEVVVALIGQNLLILSPYRGADPASRLYGNSGASGLDLFNQPATRSYSLQIKLKI